jgi:hypothetical protein
MIRASRALLFSLAVLLLSGCAPAAPGCPQQTGTPEYLTVTPPTAQPVTAADHSPPPTQIEIAGGIVSVDQVVVGPLCNGAWSGTVYVTCDVQVLPWQDLPTFLRDCDLNIAPDTVVYVAYHGDAPYYNGCSCHTGEIAEP